MCLQLTWVQPFLVAICNAVSPLLSSKLITQGSGLSNSSTISIFWPFTAMWRAVWPFLSVLKQILGSLVRRDFTTSKCPILPAEWRAVLPLLLAILTRLASVSRRRFTASIWPLLAAVCKAVEFDESVVIARSGKVCDSSLNTSAKPKGRGKTLQNDSVKWQISISLSFFLHLTYV